MPPATTNHPVVVGGYGYGVIGVIMGGLVMAEVVGGGGGDVAVIGGGGDGSGRCLLEQWKKTYEDANYDYVPYDDDMYEGQDIPNKIQSICDNLDIKVRSCKKK
ncbi:hypothetical protein Tco_0921893 [Tanacetum coccineum]